jgi:hypothetical protein
MPHKNNLLKARIENAEKGRCVKAQRQGKFCQLLCMRFPLMAPLSLENKDNTSIPIDTALQHAVEEHEGGREDDETKFEAPYNGLEIVKQSALDQFNYILQNSQRIAAEAKRKTPQKCPKRYTGRSKSMLK